MIEQIAEKLLSNALEKRVSDVHMLPIDTMYHVFFRYVGKLVLVQTLETEQAQRLISYFKYISHMDVGEKRKAQSGSCVFRVREQELELRMSTISNFQLKESLVIRLLRQNKRIDDTAIAHYFPNEVNRLFTLLHKKQGLVIFSGPVDSGKTTTIYKLLCRKYDEKPLQIMTLEDPVELSDVRFLQTEINVHAGIDYEHLIKASLRHHPDILMIGEIRDENTAKMAIRAALTGHLVVSTLHATSCHGVIERLKDLGISQRVLQETLTGVVAQRLLPRYCALCRGDCHIHCTHIPVSQKRLALTDVLSGKNLSDYFDTLENPYGLNKVLLKAYTLAYISKNTLQEYMVDV